MKTLIFATIMVICTAGIAHASTTFTFEDVAYQGGSANIEAYMEAEYGSDITVSNAMVGNGIAAGPLGPDHYLQDAGGDGDHWFSISFNEIPIDAVSFDWAVEYNNFHAVADGEEFFLSGYGTWDSGNTGPIYFTSPVTTLTFHNSGFGEVEIDNLVVTSAAQPSTIPAPGAIVLASMGISIVGWLRRRRSL